MEKSFDGNSELFQTIFNAFPSMAFVVDAAMQVIDRNLTVSVLIAEKNATRNFIKKYMEINPGANQL